jgi:adenylate cyclase
MTGEKEQVPTPPLSSGKSPANSAADPVPATAVRDQLARVVNRPGLVSSVRLCRFLTHIVNRTIDGDIDSLKEFSIAMEVFDRTSEYDPNIDAIVRVEARRLRAKLKAYYEKGQGTVDPVLIGLRPGMSQSSDGLMPSQRIAKRLAQFRHRAVYALPCCRS